MKMMIKNIFSILFLSLLLSCATGHKTNVPLHSSVSFSEHHLRDSIFLHDSIYVHIKADTIYTTRWRTVFRDRIKSDTLFLQDTVYCEKFTVTPTEGDSLFSLSPNNIFRFAIAIFIVVVLGKCGVFEFVSHSIKRGLNR